MYNSFQGKTLRGVLNSMQAYPHILIYVDPAERHILTEYDYDILEEYIGHYNADTWLIAAHLGDN